MTNNKDYELSPGAIYDVEYGKDDNKVNGTFCGYTMIGSETTLVLESKEKIVYIPAAAIICMRLVERAPEKEPESSKDIYYG